ncbi:uncharacterized protein BXZ73DRAFT_106804 [Epithele typhae]|uniref:uncharacterized protein n=1 Tax=Epithele typhae TaxID=378194 RepID=UPI0020083877|nr:uncharacterized protein BXZ73DRAFT_106804 [Epithele typhae]KAH9913901.1 hypothetical protein BXZ73DRAFT_106804 [Epithele typhae]
MLLPYRPSDLSKSVDFFLPEKHKHKDDNVPARFDARCGHAYLAAGSLTTLTTEALQDTALSAIRGSARSTIPDVDRRVLAAVPRFVQYACTNWAVHLSQSYKDAKYGVMAALTEFAKTDACLVWVETMAWMGRGDDVGRALQTACEWLSFGSVRLRLNSLRTWVGERVETLKEYPDAVYEYKVHKASLSRRQSSASSRGPRGRGEQAETAGITYQRSVSEYTASVDNVSEATQPGGRLRRWRTLTFRPKSWLK